MIDWNKHNGIRFWNWSIVNKRRHYFLCEYQYGKIYWITDGKSELEYLCEYEELDLELREKLENELFKIDQE